MIAHLLLFPYIWEAEAFLLRKELFSDISNSDQTLTKFAIAANLSTASRRTAGTAGTAAWRLLHFACRKDLIQ
uniref:Uncharacterized protein n=1 Tax=Glossina pallidipes TaxID=7398 RepID=A0A1A9ZGN8_GLOPL